MLVRPVNMSFSKSGGCEIFIKKTGNFSLNRHIWKSRKKILQAISLLFESVSSSKEVFWGASDLLELNADILILLCSTRIMIFDGDFRIMRILYLTEADVQHLQTEAQQYNFPFPISP